MQAQNENSTQTFRMSLVEPLVLILIPLFGIYLSIRLLFSQPREVEIYVPLIMLAFSIYGLVSGLTMPRKLEHRGNEIIISYFGWKRTIGISDIKSYSYNKTRSGRHTLYFLEIQTQQGRAIKLRDIQGGPVRLLDALEQWTGFTPTVDLSDRPEDPMAQEEPEEHRPPEPLSELTEKLVQKMFPPEQQMEVRQLLINECGNNVYGHGTKDKYELESLRFSALKLSRGDLKKLHYHVRKGNDDFRDLYYGSGFCGENSEEKQRKWVESVLGKNF
jgi:hypothetical protein